MTKHRVLCMGLGTFLLAAGTALATERATLDLNGTWQYQPAESLDGAPEADA